jgi:hypothetical protein
MDTLIDILASVPHKPADADNRPELSAAGLVQEFRRRRIPPDETHPVRQGTLNLWICCNHYIAQLTNGDWRLAAHKPFYNLLTPQTIADTLVYEAARPIRKTGAPPAEDRVDYNAVDWSKPNVVLARELGVSRQNIAARRKRHAPK